MLRNHFSKHGYVHLCWTILLLILVIVALLVTRPNGMTLYNYISFASAITSLFLAMLAIIYAAISNQSFAETVGVLRDSSCSVAANALELGSSMSAVNEGLARINSMMESIPTTMKSMSDEISSKIETVVANQTEQSAPSAPTAPGKVKLGNLSIPVGCTFAFYGLALSHKYNKSFSFEDADATEYVKGMMFGASAILSATSLFDMKIDRVETNLFTASLGMLDFEEIVHVAEAQDGEIVQNLRKEIDKIFQ